MTRAAEAPGDGMHRPLSRDPNRVAALIRGALCALTLVGSWLMGAEAHAQQGMAVLVGTVSDSSTGKPVSDSLVTVTSPNLQGEEIAVTDETGVYRIPGLPPGLYTMRVEAQSFRPYAREGLDLHADTTIRLNASLLPEALKAEEVVVVGRTPTVDIGSSATGLNITSEFTSRIPLIAPGGKSAPARSFEGVADVVPGVTNDLYGASVFGASSPENRYLLDGLSVNNTTFGLLGTPLSIDFIKEVSVLSGGYMPEYGRSTGGILNAITKQGSNEFHGSVFTNWAPGALSGSRKKVNIEGGTITTTPSLRYMGDIGGDVGGPLIKDKLWFYVGFDWAQSKYNLQRSLNRTILGPDGMPVTINDVPQTESIPGSRSTSYAQQDMFQHIAKLTWAASKNDRVTLSVNGVYPVSGGNGKYGIDPQTGEAEIYPIATQSQNSLAGAYSALAHRYKGSSTNALLRWQRDLSKKMMLDSWVGWHQESGGRQPSDGTPVGSQRGLGGQSNIWYSWNAPYHNLNEFEMVPGGACDVPGSCPLQSYRLGGPEFVDQQKNNRLQARSILTYLFEAWGHHVFKIGLDAEYQRQNGIRAYTGAHDFTEYSDIGIGAAPWYSQGYGYLTGPDQVQFLNAIHNKTSSVSLGGFAQDSWNVADLVTLNLGLRYDAQLLFGRDDQLAMTLPSQWSPRAGVIFDPTFKGKSKIYGNYARYYETVPLRMLDRYLSGEPLIQTLTDPSACNPADPTMVHTACLDPNNLLGVGDAPNAKYIELSSGTSVIDPKLKAPSNDELVFGGEYEIVRDGRLGLNYTRRWLTNTIEDMSLDDARTFFFGNPGHGIARDFPKAQRRYDAGTLYFTKMFSDGWIAQTSYTLSWLRGNYGGLYRADDRQFDPHQNSDFDLRSLFVNRKGDLPGDNRHYIKAFGAKEFVLPGKWGVVTPGLSLRAYSGGPTNYLGSHPVYLTDQVYILPRGAGERLPWVTTIDLRIAYGYQFTKTVGISATFDIFNLFNFQAAIARDQHYTNDVVAAVRNKSELPTVDVNGNMVTPNPNFGNPAAYQPPRTFRFGLKGTF
ncbi:MAG TPA: TonB-dependent receptor [Polyangiales bacterium]